MQLLVFEKSERLVPFVRFYFLVTVFWLIDKIYFGTFVSTTVPYEVVRPGATAFSTVGSLAATASRE